jgi:acetyl/propionyl-CoA carboxylase alpha subunit
MIRVFEIFMPREWQMNPYMLRQMKVVSENVLKCPMPGLITAIASPCDGYVEKIVVPSGQTVETNDTLMTFQ